MRLELAPRPQTQAFLDAALALVAGGAVFLLWPITGLGRLGHEHAWFGLAWTLLLAMPTPAPDQPDAAGASPWGEPYLTPQACQRVCLMAAGLFVAMLLAGRGLGNYKLWLGVVYLSALTARLAGLGLALRESLLTQSAYDLRLAVGLAVLTSLAGLFIVPWVRPDLAAAWPPPLPQALRPLAGAVLWGATVGALYLGLRLWGVSARTAWLVYHALGLGLGPALAVGWPRLSVMALALLAVLGLGLPRLLKPGLLADSRPTVSQPMPLYWLLRGLLLLWWGVGAAFTLALAWWQPLAGSLFTESIWLRGVGLGAFLVACVGLLVEYSLPLLGRPDLAGVAGQGKAQGMILSALALLAALAPLLLARPNANEIAAAQMPSEARAELISQPIVLDPEHPEVELKTPGWLGGVTRVFVVSLLAHGLEVPQGEAVAQLVATDDQDIPHIFSLRAGVDTAEWALNKREVANHVKHAKARIAQSWQVFEPTGEAFQAHTYYTGLFLGSDTHRIKSITLRYLYRNAEERHPVTLEIRKLFLN